MVVVTLLCGDILQKKMRAFKGCLSDHGVFPGVIAAQEKRGHRVVVVLTHSERSIDINFNLAIQHIFHT